MKQIILFIILMAVIVFLLTACSKEETVVPEKNYTLTARVENGILYVDYKSNEYGIWVIYVSPDKFHLGRDTQKFSGEGYGCSGMSTNLFSNGWYVTLDGVEQIKI